MQNRIKLSDVGHFFDTGTDRIDLFENVSLELQAGRSHAIVGPSGAGKSSLLTIMAGLDEPRRGAVTFHVDGRQVDAVGLRARSGFVFQQFHLMPELDALANLALPLRLKGDPDAQDKARNWLARVGLEGRAGHQPSRLSGGEQQRAAIARAFISEPAFLFADEPTGNLDAVTSTAVSDLMFDCARESGCCMVVVTHSEALASRTDTGWMLRDKRLEPIR
ncbi:ABC transporter ATP-binding protein [Parasphingopyxis sp.]|uniref:ABC transporter ATP-binding protein n=1 Tax=Parasphingopyxis sp. TaxID=1920299 RepID=UPI002601A0DC|nr:ABC transporter ATP-binding protein [Parasphingopyxis sp.]